MVNLTSDRFLDIKDNLGGENETPKKNFIQFHFEKYRFDILNSMYCLLRLNL